MGKCSKRIAAYLSIALAEVAIWATGKYEHISILVPLAERCKLQNGEALLGCCL